MSSPPVQAARACPGFRFRAGLASRRKTHKHKKTTVTSQTYGPQYRGTNLVRPGPLYFSGVYLGDDPDPNIRFQIMRDITGRFGGTQLTADP